VATLHKDVNSAKLRKYFDDEFPKINANTTVWNAFLKWSGHQEGGKPSVEDAKKAALQVIAKGATQQVNKMDTIVADPKNTANTDRSANGIFYTSDPDTIFMQSAIVEFYDANIDSTVYRELAVQLVESTCLHELVHLLNYKHHKKVRGFTDDGGGAIKEMGKSFEKEAYGKDVGSEGWMRMAAAKGAAIPAKMADAMQVFEGIIAKIESNPSVLVLTDADKGDLRHKLAPTVRVTIDGKPKSPSDLQKGMRARATPMRIEALDKNKDFAK
jgi:zincin-like metallopeptidase toxin 3 of polymorphic toxin system